MAHSPGFSRLRHLFATARLAAGRGIPPSEAREAYTQALLDRRSVLKAMAAGAALAALPGGIAACSDETSTPARETRVAVIGAGIAGLHCAYRLRQADVNVTVYEAQDRVGGRMWTGRGVFPDGLLYEIGGELIDSNHATMLALAEELQITLDDRWSFEPAGMVRETWFIGGARVSNETLLEQTMAVASLMSEQVDAAETDDTAFEELDNTSLQDWLEEYVPAATHPELHEVLRVAFVGEFGLEADQQSALNLLYLFGYDSEEEFLIFGESDERWHTHLGNDTFTTALADAIGRDNIVTGRKLVRAAGGAAGPYTLTLEPTAGGAASEVEVDHVVFAIPFTLLRLIDLTGLALSDTKREIIAEIGYGTNAKVMGGFTSRPWWEVHNESGLLTTDRPLGQGWDTTVGQEVESGAGVWTNFLGGDVGAASSQGTAASQMEAVLDDLDEVWPGTRAAFTGQAERMHWPTYEWSRGSYTCYRPGQWAYWSLEGEREGNVHFCGEHCSLDFQGWMEGAAETGGLVATVLLEELGAAPSSLRLTTPGMAALLRERAERDPVTGKLRWMRRSRRLRRRSSDS